MITLEFLPADKNPKRIPDGLKPFWSGGPDAANVAAQQVVLKSEGDTVYVFSYNDNRNSMAFVTYHGSDPGTPVEKAGARYPWALGMDPTTGVVTVSGQANHLVTVTLDELGLS